MRPARLASVLALPYVFAFAACGGDDGGDDHDGGVVDAGPPTAYNCNGQPLPTTATDPLGVSGVVTEVSASGTEPIEGVVIEAFTSGSATVQATAASGNGGAYTMSIATGGSPLAGYVRGRRPGMDEFRDSYLYPPAPLATDTADAPLLFISDGTFDLLQLLARETQASGNGWIGVLVVDCFNAPVAGATVTTTPSYGVKYNLDGLPNPDRVVTADDGIAYVFNVTPGQVTVDASFDGQSFREHAIEVRANVITTTAVAPGVQWPAP